eukprot:1965439-Amphidinium_carterae.1
MLESLQIEYSLHLDPIVLIRIQVIGLVFTLLAAWNPLVGTGFGDHQRRPHFDCKPQLLQREYQRDGAKRSVVSVGGKR